MYGLMRVGAEVLGFGSGPLPMLLFGARRMNAEAAVMVTGAAAPPEYNGVRLFLHGCRIGARGLLAVTDCAACRDFTSGAGSKRDVQIAESYVSRLAQLGTDRMSSINAVWDAGCGLASPLIRELTRQLNGHHLVLNETSGKNRRVASGRRQSGCHLEPLASAVVHGHCHVGFAFDATGERMVALDSQGRILPLAQTSCTGTSDTDGNVSDPFRQSVMLCAKYAEAVRNNSA
jgi:phosphomannomutase/phosphoglucomutase